jgi:hypothetical protein
MLTLPPVPSDAKVPSPHPPRAPCRLLSPPPPPCAALFSASGPRGTIPSGRAAAGRPAAVAAQADRAAPDVQLELDALRGDAEAALALSAHKAVDLGSLFSPIASLGDAAATPRRRCDRRAGRAAGPRGADGGGAPCFGGGFRVFICRRGSPHRRWGESVAKLRWAALRLSRICEVSREMERMEWCRWAGAW